MNKKERKILIENYFSDEISSEDLLYFNTLVKKDLNFAEEVDQYREKLLQQYTWEDSQIREEIIAHRRTGYTEEEKSILKMLREIDSMCYLERESIKRNMFKLIATLFLPGCFFEVLTLGVC